MELPYSFHPTLVLRTPALPLAGVDTPTDAAAWLADAQFVEALYLASPNLYAECRRWQQGKLRDPKKVAKLHEALGRYHSRMSSRCTPFGLFAGCSVVHWGHKSCLGLDPTTTTRRTRLDMQYLCSLAAHLATHETLRDRLHYIPNSSLYDLGNELRYVEHYYTATAPEGEHQISSVGASDALHQVVAAASAGGLTRWTLAQLLVDPTTHQQEAALASDLSDALDFIDELVTVQLLVSELEPTVTGPDFLEYLAETLAQLNAPADSFLTAVCVTLTDVRAQLRNLDAPGGQPNDPTAYDRLAVTLTTLGVPFELGRLFQVDWLPGVQPAASVDTEQQATLLAALRVLGHLAPPTAHERLTQFKQQFAARYEMREVPLLEALDTESGISYSDFGRDSYAPLVDNLVLPSSELPNSSATTGSIATLTTAQQLLARKLREARQTEQYAIEITLADVQALPSVADGLSPSIAVVFRTLAGGELLLEHAGGSSAANLLGRFAHASPAITELISNLTQVEQVHNPGVILAEICHLPASRTGNILARPCFRAYELPYLAQPACPPAGRLALQDLVLRLHQGQLELRCRRTGRRVVPRLSSAHNYTQQALPVYQLLCDLQTQGRQASLGVSWGEPVLETQFWPRLTHQRVILLPASWQFLAADLAPLLAGGAANAAIWSAFQARWQLPRYFTLTDGDHHLLVDAEQPASVQRWLSLVRTRASCQLTEFLFMPATCLVRDPAGQPYANQLVASLVRTTPCYSAQTTEPGLMVPAALPRTFTLGSEWLYYKLYCGPQVACRLLTEVIGPLTEELLAQGLIDHWFFIRYADPDPHLRIRLHLPQVSQLGLVVAAVAEALADYITAGSLWKLQTDTYQRELERYGPTTIALAEQLFYYDSRRLVARLAQPDSVADPDHADWLGAAAGIDELLTAFAYTLPDKLTFVTRLRDSFAREFNSDKALRLQLDTRYRQYRALLSAALRPIATVTALPLEPLLPAVARQLLTHHAQGQLEVPLNSMLGSCVHMLVNRAVSTQSRLHELLLYDFLARYYQGRLAGQPA